MNQAKVYLVGTGPGDPELLTVKAARILHNADVVIYDRLVSEAILEQVPAGATRVYVGKKTSNHTLPQNEINRLLVTLAEGQHTIVRLKGGDPFIFGRGSEEALCLAKQGIKFEVIPGVTAASGCASYAGIPLTHRGLARGIQVVTGHSQAGQPLDLDWKALAHDNKTLVVYMGLANIELISRELIAAGLDKETPAAAIKNGTTAHQQRVLSSLSMLAADCRKAMLQPPVIFVIGKVVSLANSLDWFVTTEDIADEYFPGPDQVLHG